MGGTVRRFALDQNFPDTILPLLEESIPEAVLVPLRKIDVRLVKDVDDWEILHALYHHAGAWDGMITTDTAMLKLPRELAVLKQTKLTLIATDRAGNDPLRAAGLLMTHLPHVCKNSRKDLAQVWLLSATQKNHDDPWAHLEKLAARANTAPVAFFDKFCLSESQLATNPLPPDND